MPSGLAQLSVFLIFHINSEECFPGCLVFLSGISFRPTELCEFGVSFGNVLTALVADRGKSLQHWACRHAPGWARGLGQRAGQRPDGILQ